MMHEENSGFGVLNLKINESGAYTLKDGYYQEATPDAHSLTHDIKKLYLDDVGNKLSDNPLDYSDYILKLSLI